MLSLRLAHRYCMAGYVMRRGHVSFLADAVTPDTLQTISTGAW